MADTAQVMRIYNQLQEIRRTRPDVYDLIVEAINLPPDKFNEFMRQIMPTLRRYMN